VVRSAMSDGLDSGAASNVGTSASTSKEASSGNNAGNHGGNHGLNEGIIERKIAKARKVLHAILVEKGNGSFLRGWRREIDPDGSLDVGTEEFSFQVKRLGVEGISVQELVAIDGDKENLSLEELAPEEGALVISTREWIKETFGDPASMWDAVDTANAGSLEREAWQSGCMAHGFTGTEEDLSCLFDFIDVDEGGSISKEEILFLETDSAARDTAIFKEKMKAKGQLQRLLASVYWADKHNNAHPSSRSAPKPWMANDFEALPPLVIVKRQQRLRQIRKQQREARACLEEHLRLKYGTCSRAWRRGLDPNGRFSVSKMSLRHFCRVQELNINIQALWTELDTDSDGIIGINDVASQGAAALAAFKAWCSRHHGSCTAVWNHPEMVKARSERQNDGNLNLRSSRKILTSLFLETLKLLGWSCTLDSQAEIWSALDYFNAGFLSQEDLAWLDSWKPPLWLTSYPSEEEWNAVKDLFLARWGSPLNAWKQLDRDGQNELSWAEFLEGCKKVKFKGDMGAAWRFIDDNASGCISMKEFSLEQYELLMSFKEWASGLFGSVGNAMKNFDKDGSGSLTLGELRRSCQKGKWEGDARELFDCLFSGLGKDGASKREMKTEDIAFLDSWPERDEEEDQEEEEEEVLMNSPKKSPKNVKRVATGVKPMSAEPQSRSKGEAIPAAAEQARPNSSPALVTGGLYTSSSAPQLLNANIELSASGAPTIPMAMSPEKKKQLQRTYHCASSMSLQLRSRQRRKQREAGKGNNLPWLEKLNLIDFDQTAESVGCGRRSRRVPLR